jgi:hypothetical protein
MPTAMKTETPTTDEAMVPARGPRAPEPLRRRAERLAGMRDQHRRSLNRLDRDLSGLDDYLQLAVPVTDALRLLGEQLFGEVLGKLETRLSIALQDVLDQPDINVRAEADFKRGGATVGFSVERNGNREDIQRGQGGSVHNILSVGLRIFALATLDPAVHRGLLVLDEQDCWLRPDLVPGLVKMVADAAHELGFQVLMISHHDVRLFEQFADRIDRLEPAGSTVTVRHIAAAPPFPDSCA